VLSDLPGDNGAGNPTSNVKLARIVDQDDDTFCLEYPTRSGETTMMRLEASTYEGAIREAKTYLEVGEDDRDATGAVWQFD
jgi:CRISPR/Cas system-associated protein Cas7 (RAMP superfamily)